MLNHNNIFTCNLISKPNFLFSSVLYLPRYFMLFPQHKVTVWEIKEIKTYFSSHESLTLKQYMRKVNTLCKILMIDTVSTCYREEGWFWLEGVPDGGDRALQP